MESANRISPHEAVWDWLLTCPHIQDLFFTFYTAENGATALVPLTTCTDAAEQEFVDGSSIRNYDFTILRFAAYSTAPNDAANIAALAAVEDIAAWIRAQDAAKNYPAFGPDCDILGVEVLPGGEFGAWDESGAKYALQIRIRYEKE